MDVFSNAKRSEIMSRVKGRGNVATELALVALLRRNGITGWRRNYRLLGTPDFVFPRQRAAVFVDGCFWHGCSRHWKAPDSNRGFWLRKVDRNIKRDRLVNRTLKASGWRVVRIWQHDLKHPEKVLGRIERALG